MEFLLERVEVVKPGIDGFKTVRVELYIVNASAYFLGNILEFYIAALHSFSHLLHIRINLLDVVNLLGCILQFVENAAVFARECIICFIERSLDVFRMTQGFCFLFQLLKFAFLQVCVIQFLKLEAHEFLVLPVLCDFRFQVFQLLLSLFIVLVFGKISLLLLFIVGNNIDHAELEVFLLQQEVLVLRMNIDELFAQFSHLAQGDGRVVDEGTAFSGSCQFAADDGVFCIIINIVSIEEILHSVF